MESKSKFDKMIILFLIKILFFGLSYTLYMAYHIDRGCLNQRQNICVDPEIYTIYLKSYFKT